MRFEDLEIRIARDGTVYIYAENVSEDRIRDLKHFLEEEIGPIKSMEVVRKPDWDQPAIYSEDDLKKKGESELEQES